MPLTPPDSEIMASQPLSNDKKNSAQTALVNTSLRVGMQMLWCADLDGFFMMRRA
jgi:hypothetical protein